MKKILAVINVLRYGVSVADPATLKNRQNLGNALLGLLGALVVFLPMEVSADDLANIVSGIVAIAGLFNVYATTASTNKIGLFPASKNSDSGMQPSPGELSDEYPAPQHPFDHTP